MDPVSVVVMAALAVGVGAMGAVAGFVLGRAQGGVDRERMLRRVQEAGFRPHEGGWKQVVGGREVYLVLEEDGSFELVTRCGELPFVVMPGADGDTGDETFDARLAVKRRASGGVVWRHLGRETRQALVRLSFRGDVRIDGSRVRLVGEGPTGELGRLTADLVAAAIALEPRGWDTVIQDEPRSVQTRILRELVDHDPSTARVAATHLLVRGFDGGDPALATEIARATADDEALLQLLPSQPDEAAVVRLASCLSVDGLVLALSQAASYRSAISMAGCSRAALDRASEEAVQHAALASLQTWLQPGALKMPFVQEVAVRLLRVGRDQLGEAHAELLGRMLAVQEERAVVLALVARYGTPAQVPALRALEAGADLQEGVLVRRAIAGIQARAVGDAGALSVAEEGGELSLAPQGSGGLSVGES